jgi:sugar phosphate isomerase/epimerase
MRIGIDSYSYHRLLGEVRPGERPAAAPIPDAAALVGEMVAAGGEVLSLETVFLDAPGALDTRVLLDAADGRELALAWGHPYGLRWGADPDALDELLAWIHLAPALGVRLVRCVAAHPALRPPGGPTRRQLEPTARALCRALARARAHGITLALENHGDVDAAALSALLTAVPGLTVCLDTANALRVGDDPVALARAVAPHVAMVHLKDVADAGPDPRSVPYGEGVVDLDGVLAALPSAPDLPVCIELAQLGDGAVDERALVRQGVAWLAGRWEATVVA